MMEEEVVSVRGGEISDSADADQHKIKAEYCNGVAHDNGNQAAVANGTVGDHIVAAGSGGDSGASDLVEVEGVAVGESDVAASEAAAAAEEAECGCETVNNKNENNDCEEEKTEISNGAISVGGDVQNDEGSVVVSDVSGDAKKDVTDSSEIQDREFEVRNGAENEVSDGVVGANGGDANGIHQNGEILGDESDKGVSGDEVKDDVVAVEVEKEDGADVNGANSELESVAVENCVVNKENNEASDAKECADDEDGQSNPVEKAHIIESVDSGGGDEKEDGGNAAAEGTSESVSDEKKEVVSVVVQGVTDREFENVVDGDVQNGSVDAEKDEIPVGVDGDAAAAAVDVKECKGEDVEISSDVEEKAKVETVSDLDADKSVASAETPIEGERSKNDSSSVEVSEVESGHELAPGGEDSSASISTNVPGDGNAVSDVNDIAVESEGEPLNNAEQSEAEPSAEGEISVECEGGSRGDEETRATQEGSSTDALDGQNMGSEVVRRPFYYLIRVPRYDDDENIKDQIKIAFHQVEEKTRTRDAVRAESQAKKGICKEYNQEFRAALSAERAARDLLKSKRQEMDSVQSTMNRLNNAISVGDIDGKIRNMEHMIEHETLPLKEEKQLIRQIKQLKQSREELSSSMGKQDQSQHALDHKDSIEENLKQLQLLKKEVELLRSNVQKAEVATKAARKKYDDECHKMNEISAQFKAADDIRQEAYAKLQTLKKQLHEKSKYFWEYKNASKKGQELAAEGKREELQCFCIDQVERIMEMWNKNDEFRQNYVRCNIRSTVRRLQTLDGRSLGPDEEPPVIPNALTERASKNNSLISQSIPEQERKSTTEPANIKDEPISKAVVQKTEKSQTTKAKKPVKPAPVEKPVAAIARWGDEPEDPPEEPVRTKEEEEQILNAEKARKEEEAARLKEMRRLEEIEKAREAMERKKRNAEKAQQRAALKAQKEAEQKEKEREKKLRKKERRKAAFTETAENTEQESACVSETVTRSTEECDQSEKPVEVTKKPQKPSQFTRQTKAKSIPLPLRNRGKRRFQPWMWALFAVLVIVALFFMGNSSSLRSRLPGSGY